uniref:Uncharacterized protein n=1 Tax=Megaviridae environmental sample TaxID=1737588 RepID=A0A5J6VHP9_9VIRU|nr:MAG: hypothetical protein [Megaviridae environmental sample]
MDMDMDMDMNEHYRQKYLKYKQKYLAVKDGGVKIQNESDDPRKTVKNVFVGNHIVNNIYLNGKLSEIIEIMDQATIKDDKGNIINFDADYKVQVRAIKDPVYIQGFNWKYLLETRIDRGNSESYLYYPKLTDINPRQIDFRGLSGPTITDKYMFADKDNNTYQVDVRGKKFNEIEDLKKQIQDSPADNDELQQQLQQQLKEAEQSYQNLTNTISVINDIEGVIPAPAPASACTIL